MVDNIQSDLSPSQIPNQTSTLPGSRNSRQPRSLHSGSPGSLNFLLKALFEPRKDKKKAKNHKHLDFLGSLSLEGHEMHSSKVTIFTEVAKL